MAAKCSNLVYNSHGKKYEVPRVRVSSINELQRADHIAFHQLGAYWHHAIVENIDIERGEIHVIEYTNTAREFVNDNCSPPKLKGMTKAKVVKNQYKFQEKVVYLMKHDRCLDPDDVISRAQSKLGERNYGPVTNNCEHFAMWCKTGNSSSDQVNKAKGMVVHEVVHEVEKEVLTQVAEIGKEFLTQTASDPNTRFLITWFLKVLDVMIQKSLHSSEKVMYAGLRTLFIELFTETGEEVAKTGAGETLKKVLIEMAYAAWQEATKGVSTPTAFKGFCEILTQTALKAAEQLLKTGVYGVGKDAFTQTLTNAGKSVVNTGSNSLDVFFAKMTAAALNESGQKAMETGAGEIGKDIFTHTFTNAGKSVVNTGSNSLDVFFAKMTAAALNESGQKAMETGAGEIGKDIFTHTFTNAGKSVVNTGSNSIDVFFAKMTAAALNESGQKAMKTGAGEIGKDIFTHTFTNAGKSVVNTGSNSLDVFFAKMTAAALNESGQKAMETGAGEIGKDIFTRTLTNAGKSVVNTGSSGFDFFFAKMTAAALTESGQKAMETGAGEIGKDIFTRTFTNAGKSVVYTGSSSLDVFFGKMTAAALTESGQEAIRTGVQQATQDAVSQAASKAGQEIVKIGTREATEEIMTQAASKAGEEIVKIGTREAAEEIVTQAASNAGQEIVKTGTREATEEIVTQAISNGGEEVVKTGAREGSEEILTQSASKSAAGTGSSLVAGAVVSSVIEGISAAYDINCARRDMEEGAISKEEFETAVKKRLITGTGNVGGSTVGSAIGQLLIPVPFVGGLVGGIVGGISGKFFGNLVANYLL